MKTNETHVPEDQAEHNRKTVSTYSLQISPLNEEDGGGFQALFPPLARSVVGYGESPQEAIADLHKALPLFLKVLEKTGQTLPEATAEKEWEDFSGKFNVRVPKILHAQLVELAEEQGVSLNSLVQTVLTSGATALTAGMSFGAVGHAQSKSKSRYLWEEDSAPATKVYDAVPFFTRERNSDEWLTTQEG